MLQPSVAALAGTVHGPSNVDGAAATALCGFPVGASLDAAANAHLADFANMTIRKIAPNGTATTLAGTTGIQGFVNGAGTAAQFNSPHDTAVLPDGSAVFVADYANPVIRRIAANGTTTTFAGGEAQGGANGAAGAATFDLPRGLALSGTGTLYVAEVGGRRIRAVDVATGNVTTVAGSGASGGADGAALAATFAGPMDIAVNPGISPLPTDDVIYVADGDNNAIRAISRNTGLVSTVIAGVRQRDGAGGAAGFIQPSGVALVGTDLYVMDALNHTMRRVNLALPSNSGGRKFITTVAGTAGAAGNGEGAGARSPLLLPA